MATRRTRRHRSHRLNGEEIHTLAPAAQLHWHAASVMSMPSKTLRSLTDEQLERMVPLTLPTAPSRSPRPPGPGCQGRGQASSTAPDPISSTASHCSGTRRSPSTSTPSSATSTTLSLSSGATCDRGPSCNAR